MQTSKVTAMIGLIMVLAFGTVSASAAGRTATIRVQGMHCKMCAASITKALKATQGVKRVTVSLKKGIAVVQYDDQKVTEAKLREVINSTGFKVGEKKAAASMDKNYDCCVEKTATQECCAS